MIHFLHLKKKNCKEIQPVHSEGDQPWVFFGGNDAKAEIPVLWPPHAKSWLIGKDSDAGRDWGQEEKGMTEDEMAGWHHWLNGRESEWTPGFGDRQGGLVCCNSWGRKELDTTEQLNWTELVPRTIMILITTGIRIKYWKEKMTNHLEIPGNKTIQSQAIWISSSKITSEYEVWPILGGAWQKFTKNVTLKWFYVNEDFINSVNKTNLT